MKYYVYDSVTGMVLRTGDCPESLIPLQTHDENDIAVDGYANDIRHKVVAGSLVLKTDQELTDQYSEMMTDLGVTLEQFKELYSNYV